MSQPNAEANNMDQPQQQQMEAGPNQAPPQSSQQQQQNLQQEPVNFSGAAGYGRRVTIGGNVDRRGSLASVGADELFGGRRTSMGFDMSMDNLFPRRDSMDSTSAALDAAFLDLTRRRSSLFLGGGGPSMASMGDMQDPAMMRPSMTGSVGPGMMRNASFGSVPFERNPSLPGQFNLPNMPPPPPLPPSLPQGGNSQEAVTNIAARQKQLQQQQRELEQYQKVLELQRQQLLNNMQERSYNMYDGMGSPPGRYAGGVRFGGLGGSMGFGGGSMGLGSGSMGLGGSLGLGSMHSQGSHGSSSYAQSPLPQHRSSNQNWWICQFCNSKAFSSREEAVSHESICQHRRPDHMHPLPMQDMSQRSYSMSMDTSAHSMHSHQSVDQSNMSNGPFSMLTNPIPLAMPSDKDWLTPLHCFVRLHCVEVFTASEQDVATPSKGKRKPIQVGQIGIRCPHCHEYEAPSQRSRERGSVYYPTTISSVYNATMNLLQRHLHSCPAVPADIMRRYETLKADDARSGTSKRYWVESAHSLGLVDTPHGIRFSALRPPPLPSLTSHQTNIDQEAARRNSNEFFSTKSNAVTDSGDKAAEAATDKAATVDAKGNDAGATSLPKSEQAMADSAPLVTPDDKPYATTFSYHLLSQMQPCVFTEADRLGKRKGLPPGFPGLACRHCFGGYGSGRFFPSSIKTLSDTSKTLNVLHNHMMRCRKCPAEVRETLEGLRSSHDEERAKMKFGSQKAFFARIWERLHGKGKPAAFKRPLPQPKQAPYPHNPQTQGMMMSYHPGQMGQGGMMSMTGSMGHGPMGPGNMGNGPMGHGNMGHGMAPMGPPMAMQAPGGGMDDGPDPKRQKM